MNRKSISLSERISPATFGFVLAAPAIVALALVVVYPLSYNIYLSFSDVDLLHGTTTFSGLENYVDLFTSGAFWNALRNTLFLAALAVSLEMLLGFGMALALNLEFPFVGIVRSLLITPVMIAPVVAALQWRWMYAQEYGVLNYLVQALGLDAVGWLSSSNVAIYSIILVDIWQTFPFVMLILLAGLQSLPPDCYDAARVDGCTKLQTLRYVTIPLLKPVLLVALLIRTTDVFRIFDTIYVLTGGGPGNSTEVIGTLTYRETFQFINFGGGAALSLVSLVVSCIVGLLYLRVLKPDE